MQSLQLTMTETLFGGMALVIALFFVLRKTGVTIFWSGVISALTGVLGYLIYSLQHWESGDVLAIHVVVYLASAGVLVGFSNMQVKQNKMHWAPKLIIYFFVFLAVLNAVLLSLSMHGLPHYLASAFLPNASQKQVNTAFPGVMPHDKNKSYEPHLEELAKQRALGWSVDASALKNLRAGQNNRINVRVVDKQGQALSGAVVTLDLWRIADSRDDLQLKLDETTAGQYLVTWKPYEGRWMSLLTVERGEDRYTVKASLNVAEQ
jgi:hypothetical protein